MRKEPLISVGMPVYNGEKYISQAVQSILNQTLADFELIISDNASSDGTEDICRSLEKKDKRIIYLRNKLNLGAARNYNILVEKARAQYFRWHNVDDLIAETSHDLCFKTLQENQDAVLAFGKTKIIDCAGKVLENYEDNLHIADSKPVDRFIRFRKNVGFTNAIYGLMRIDALRKTHLFRKFKASDTNFMGELVLYGKFIQIPDYLFYRRMHEDASSWDRKNKQLQKDFWDPSATKFNYQYTKKHFSYYTDVLSSDLNYFEKIKLMKFLLRMTRYARGHLWKDLVYSLKNKI